MTTGKGRDNTSWVRFELVVMRLTVPLILDRTIPRLHLLDRTFGRLATTIMVRLVLVRLSVRRNVATILGEIVPIPLPDSAKAVMLLLSLQSTRLSTSALLILSGFGLAYFDLCNLRQLVSLTWLTVWGSDLRNDWATSEYLNAATAGVSSVGVKVVEVPCEKGYLGVTISTGDEVESFHEWFFSLKVHS